MKKYFSTKTEFEGSAEWSAAEPEPDNEMIPMSIHEELQSSSQSSRESSKQHSASSNQTDYANLEEMDDNDDSMLEVLR